MNSEQHFLEVERLEKQLVETLVGIAGLELKGNRAWTREIKSRLSELAEQNDLRAYGFTELDPTSAEWLFDLTWFKIEADKAVGYDRITRFVLAVESEWGLYIEDILYDFEKLVVCNADLRLMICESSRENYADRVESMKSIVREYNQLATGSRFMTAIWIDSEKRFQFDFFQKK